MKAPRVAKCYTVSDNWSCIVPNTEILHQALVGRKGVGSAKSGLGTHTVGTPISISPRALADIKYQNLNNEVTVELREKVVFLNVFMIKVEKDRKNRVT